MHSSLSELQTLVHKILICKLFFSQCSQL
jgi:hypothetical protein